MNDLEMSKPKDKARANIYTPHGNVDSVNYVFGFLFGYLNNNDVIKPGKSNQQLADFIKAKFPNAPLLLQFEINDALRRRNSNIIAD